MNVLFMLISFSSLIIMLISAPQLALPAMLNGGKSAIELSIKMLAIYTVWLSLLKTLERGGLNNVLSGLFRPLTKRLFKKEDEETQKIISMNFAANFLGMGGAATPLGIRAMERMQDGSDTATNNMIMFMVINATSIQLLPTTIIALRQEAGSVAAGNIILPTFIATLITTTFGIILTKIFCAKNK